MLKRIINRIAFFILSGFIILFFYLRFGGYFFIDNSIKDTIVENIKTSSSFPKRFYELYEIANPKALSRDYISHKVDQIFFNNHNSDSPSALASYIGTSAWLGSKQFMLTCYIEDKTTQKECLSFYAQNFDFLYKNIGIEQASLFYFGKELDKLEDKEMMTLIIMMKNPSLYNPIRSPEKVETKLKELLNRS